MKRIVFFFILTMSLLATLPARAQQVSYWIQVEANNTLRAAEISVRRYAERIDNVKGFRVNRTGWYAVAIGPFTETQALQRLSELRAQLPGDAYVSDSTLYSTQFWPVGDNALAAAPVTETAPQAPVNTAPAATEPAPAETTPAAETAPVESAPAELPDETKAQARASERNLTREERKALQIALQWGGFYTSGIDGAFGPGTRNSMARWQEARGYEQTGILTTRQRAELLAEYQAVLDTIGLTLFNDPGAGINITIPAAMVSFNRYEAPFAHYEGDQGVRVVLISQAGDKATLFGLYDILQSLAVVPKDGPRQRRERDFTIEGANSELISYTYAKLTDGAVKGFMLIWPQGARITAEDGSESYEVDRRRALVLDAMRQSFAPIPGAALPDNAGLDQAEQSIDLVSGLKIRKAERARSGFFVTEQGDVLTTLEAVQNCGSVTLEDAYPANIVATDEQLGLALLRPQTPLAPMAIAELLNFDPRIGSELAVAGFSYGGRLPSPTLTFGMLAETRGLAGETQISRLNVTVQDGDAGGPVLDQGGAVIGMLLAAPTEGKLLPQGVGLTAKGTALAEFLAANGVTATMTQIQGALTPYDLTNNAANMTVLVSCWK